jgi:hypothetical protein
MTMKQKILKALHSLPDDASFEDAIERLAFLAKTESGLKQADAGQTISHAELKRRMGPKKGRLSLAQMLKGVTKENRPGQIDWGVPVGREIW